MKKNASQEIQIRYDEADDFMEQINEANLVNKGISDLDNSRVVDGNDVKAKMAEKYEMKKNICLKSLQGVTVYSE